MPIIRVNDDDASRLPTRSSGSPPADRSKEPNDDVTLAGILASLRRHVFLILGASALVGLIAAAMVLREPPVYRAVAVVRLTDARNAMTRGIDDDNTERLREANRVTSQFQLLTSRALVGSVVDSEGLRLQAAGRGFPPTLLTQVHVDSAVARDTFRLRFSSTGFTVESDSHVGEVPYNVPYRAAAGVSFAVASRPPIPQVPLVVVGREQLIDEILRDLRVSQRYETNVVDVSYTDEVPEFSQRIVNRLVQTFQNVDVRLAQGQSHRRRLFLEDQLREVTAELGRSEAALTDFRSREQLFSPREKFQAQQSSLATLDMRLGELDADRRMYQSLLANLQDSTGANADELRALITAPDITTNPVISQLYTQLTQYQSTRDSLTTGKWRSTSTNPDVARLDQLIAGNQQRLVSAIRGHIVTMDARHEALAGIRKNNADAIAQLPRAESAEEQLSLQVASNRALADRLRDEYHNARMAEAVEAGQVDIMDLASVPYRPIGRLRTLRLLLGVLVGFGAGCLIALVIDRRNAPVTGRVDLEEQMRLPVLSVIPPITVDPRRTPARATLSSVLGVGKRPDVERAINAVEAREEFARVNGNALLSPAGAEAFRLLRSSLKWTQRDTSSRTLAITSALSSEGKTTTSANLAAACALEGKRVLLIDCDLRRPRLHQVFRLPRQPGIAQVLWAGVSPSAAVRETFVDGLFVLPAGAYTERFGDLVGSGRMPSVLAELSACFDMVILDTPPVLAVADAAAVAPLVDGVLLVVAGATNRHAVGQALRQLESVGARVIGAVLNDSRGEVQRYGGYQHYYQQYEREHARSTNTA